MGSQQCGRWFQDSLPASLPEGAKDGAANQYLSSQCSVNYVEKVDIGDQFARKEEETYKEPQTNDVLVDAQTDQGQTSDVYNDAQTNEDQTNNNGYNDAQASQAQTNGYNDDLTITNDAVVNQVEDNVGYDDDGSGDGSENLLIQGAVRKSNPYR